MTTVLGISLIGWIHTITGSIAIFIGIYILCKYKLIAYSLHSGKIYIFLTGISAATSLLIFNKGEFNLAHLLGLFTLFALFIGFTFAYIFLYNFKSKMNIVKYIYEVFLSFLHLII